MDKVVHFELPIDNLDRAKKFYKETFGWDTKDYPELHYTTIKTVETDDKMMPKESGAINGGMFKRGDGANAVMNPSLVIAVQDIDEAIKKIKNAGGLIIQDKMEIPDVGMIAYFKDTEGNILSAMQPMKK